ncbi:MAG: helix-turn-helix domain-containing protein [Myxococcota bacterium]
MQHPTLRMESIGRQLRRERELRQVSLEELAQLTRIPRKMLLRLEEDRFDDLPGEVFAKGFLRSYARALGIDAEPLVDNYGRAQDSCSNGPAPITAITPPERGRRFGIAIAVVIFTILFTLALSIVWRPRQRDTPIELSDRDISSTSKGGVFGDDSNPCDRLAFYGLPRSGPDRHAAHS